MKGFHWKFAGIFMCGTLKDSISGEKKIQFSMNSSGTLRKMSGVALKKFSRTNSEISKSNF